MPLQPNITAVQAADYPRIVDVWEASTKATHHFVAESDLELFKPIVRDVLPHMPIVCMRDEAGQVVGFIGVSNHHIEMLFIHPDWRGQGIGRQLLTYAIQHMGGQTLDVNEQNEQAVGFYLKMGLIVVGRAEVDSFGKPYPLLHLRVPSQKAAG